MSNSDQRTLIDNSTLSGVERLIGLSKVINLNYLDYDILCLEKLVTAILFSDRLLAVDDYKDTYRANRLKKFNFIEFLKIETSTYQSISADAANFAQGMTFGFAGSEPTGDVLKFFDALRINPQLRWDVFASSEYLTLTYLIGENQGNAHERAIDAGLRQEQTDAKMVSSDPEINAAFFVTGQSDIKAVKQLVSRLGNGNPNYSGEDGKSALQRMVFGYGWTAERAFFYNGVAAQYRANASLAPMRDAFGESCLRLDYPAKIPSLIEKLKSSSRKAMSAILEPSGQAQFALRTPFFASYLISKTDNPAQCIDLALNLRQRQEFKDCRAIFHNLQHQDGKQKIQSLNSILRFLEQSLSKLLKEYCVSTPNGVPLSISLGLTGPSVGASLKTSGLFRSYKDRPFAKVFRSISQDMVNVEGLGALHDKLTSEVREHADANYPSISTTPKFMRKRSSDYGYPANEEK